MGRSLAIAALALLAAAAPAGHAERHHRSRDLLVLAVLSPERGMVADPGTGVTRERRLPGGTLCHGPMLAVGSRVVFPGTRGGPDRAVALTLPFSMSGRARSLGAAEAFLRSTTPGRLWLARWHGRPRRWSDRPVPVELREVDAAGQVTARVDARLPRFGTLDAALPEGFLASEGRGLTLRAPGTGGPLVLIRDAWFAAAGRSSFSWCRGDCRVIHVWRGGEDRVLRPPPELRPVQQPGAFSPDERWLAAAVGGRRRPRAAVVDLGTGRWSAVPGARLGDYRAMAWSPSGRWLYLTAGNRGLMRWRLGAAHATPLPIHPGGTVMSIQAVATRG